MKDRLASSWVLIVGSLFIAYYWWRRHPSVANVGDSPSSGKGTPGLPSVQKSFPTGTTEKEMEKALKQPFDVMRWPRAAIREFQSPYAPADHAAQLRAYHIQGDPMEGLH